MKKFKFRLENVLIHKTRLFDQAREAYLIEARKLSEAEKVFRNISKEYQKCLDDLVKATKDNFDIKNMALYHKYIFYKKYEMRTQLNEIDRVAQGVEEKRKDLLEKSKEKEALEKLKEKQFKRYEKQMYLAEQKFVDEIVSASYARKQI